MFWVFALHRVDELARQANHSARFFVAYQGFLFFLHGREGGCFKRVWTPVGSWGCFEPRNSMGGMDASEAMR